MVETGALLSAVAAALIVVVACRFSLPQDVAKRDGLALGLVTGFVVGYVLHPDWAPLVPQDEWSYLLYVAPMAALLGAQGLASGIRIYERWFGYLLLSTLTAYLLTPSWITEPSLRTYHVAALAAYLFFLTIAIEPLGKRTPTRLFALALALTAICSAGVGAAQLTAKLGSIALLAGSAALGCTLACLLGGEFDARSMVLPSVLLIAGMAHTIHLYPDPPRRGLLVIPLAPLGLWIGALPKMRKLKPWQRLVVQFAAVVAILIVGTVVAITIAPDLE